MPQAKLDKKFEGVITKIKDGSVVPPDQYIVFLAKDLALLPALETYLDACTELSADPDQIAAINDLIEDVLEWQRAHPELMKVPDIVPGEKLAPRSK